MQIVLTICLIIFGCCSAPTAHSFSIKHKRGNDASQYTNHFSPKPNLVNSNFFKKCDPCAAGVRCVPALQCPAHVRSPHHKPQVCDLPHGGHGYCCTSGRNFTDYSQKREHARDAMSDVSTSFKVMKNAVTEAQDFFNALMSREPEVATVNQREQPEFMHNLLFRSSVQSDRIALSLNHKALEKVFTSQILKKRENIDDEKFQLGEVDARLDGTHLERTCDQRPFCPTQGSRYRNPDGKCNNPDPAKGAWGAAGSPMERLLPPSYEDGIWKPRATSVSGGPLSNPRTISRQLIHDVDRPHDSLNLLFMQFGQFLTHDVSHSASVTTNDGASIRCCSKDGGSVLPQSALHFACFPILIEPDDEFYRQFDQGCINMVRSSLAPDGSCQLGYGKQLSKATHFVDASAIYGADIRTQTEVRSFHGGRLRMLDDFGRDLLPLTTDKEFCATLDKGACFFAGDGRANQLISLTALHILFAREHNRIADELSRLNPRWSDEVIFLETQRVVIAEFQHITYNEWLPQVIGTETMQRYSLGLRESGYSNDYDQNVNPAITSEFSTAAQRFGHSTVDGKFLVERVDDMVEEIEIPDVMFSTNRLRQRGFYDAILLTLTKQPVQQVDSAITKGLSRFLFRGANPFGLDLAAINIHRGRDHGIRSYNDYVEVSGHRRIASFDEFGPEAGAKLNSVYQHPDDIDLWLGGLLESARGDGIVGPTFGDIIADQFSKFRQGDRYFYEHAPEINPGAFTPDQLAQIKKVTMARLICDNSDALQEQPPKAFVQVKVAGNAPVACGQLPAMNFLPWQTNN